MIYRRSGTGMDSVSQFFPQSFMAGLRGGMRPSFATLNHAGDAPGVSPALQTPRRLMSGLGQDYEYEGVDAPAVVPASESWNWQQSIGDALKSAPAVLRDLYVAKETGDYQAKLLEINLERARQNKPPLNPDQYSPRVNVGVAPSTVQAAQRAGMVAAGVAGGIALLLVLGKRRR